ncbi:MAG: hypothetical protein R3F43_15115 [bacterium]
MRWRFPLMNKDAVQADGVDSLVVQAELFDLATGEAMPQNFGFRMWVEPEGIGTLEVLRDFNPLDAEGRWSLLDDQGRGFARFTSCNKDLPDCFRYATVRIAVEPRLLTPIDQITIENIGARLPGGGAGGAGGGAGGAGGGGEVNPLPVETCRGGTARFAFAGNSALDGMSSEFQVQAARRRDLRPQTFNYIFANDDEGTTMQVLVVTDDLGESIREQSYTDSLDQVRFELNTVRMGAPVCQGFEPDRLQILIYRTTGTDLTAYSMQFGGRCKGEDVWVSGCLNWGSP